MAKISNKDQYFHFDSMGFLEEVRRAVKNASVEIKDLLVRDVKSRIEHLPFKNNIVPLANGGKTSDADRADELLESVLGKVHQFGWSSKIDNSIKWNAGHRDDKTTVPISITAMSQFYKDSHIGWYYELGTGTREEIPFSGYWNTEAKNPFRSGHRSLIVSRPAGVWKDIGGNIRKSKGRGGVRNANFTKNIGPDVRAHRWFYKAFASNRRMIQLIYLKHIKRVDYRKFVSFQKKVVLGRKRGK